MTESVRRTATIEVADCRRWDPNELRMRLGELAEEVAFESGRERLSLEIVRVATRAGIDAHLGPGS